MEKGIFDKEKTYQFEIEGDTYYNPTIYTGKVLGWDSQFVRITDRDNIERGFRRTQLRSFWEHIPGKRSNREIEIEEIKKREEAFRSSSGRIDIDIVTNGDTTVTRDRMKLVETTLKEMNHQVDKVPIIDFIAVLKEKGFDEEQARIYINKLKKAGEAYEPTHGFLKSCF